MHIFIDYIDNFYNKEAQIKGHCYTLIVDNQKYHYEFNILDQSAIIKYDNLDYIEYVVNEHHKNNLYVFEYKTYDNLFFKRFDYVHTFKLPIKVIQISKMILNKDYLKVLEPFVNERNTYIPVNIINDEYVCLDKHHELYLLNEDYSKMVNVYIDNNLPKYIHEKIYLAKEKNVMTINNVDVLKQEEYLEINKMLEEIFI